MVIQLEGNGLRRRLMSKILGAGKVYAAQTFAAELPSLSERSHETVKARTEFVEQL